MVNGSDVTTPQPRKARVVKPSAPASKLAIAAGPPSLYLRGGEVERVSGRVWACLRANSVRTRAERARDALVGREGHVERQLGRDYKQVGLQTRTEHVQTVRRGAPLRAAARVVAADVDRMRTVTP